MTILNDEFFAKREAAQQEAVALMAQVKTLMNQAENLADQFGFSLSASFGGRSHWYNPTTPSDVDTDDDRFGDTEWQESRDYYETEGWQNSSSNC